MQSYYITVLVPQISTICHAALLSYPEAQGTIWHQPMWAKLSLMHNGPFGTHGWCVKTSLLLFWVTGRALRATHLIQTLYNFVEIWEEILNKQLLFFFSFCSEERKKIKRDQPTETPRVKRAAARLKVFSQSIHIDVVSQSGAQASLYCAQSPPPSESFSSCCYIWMSELHRVEWCMCWVRHLLILHLLYMTSDWNEWLGDIFSIT